MSSPPPLSSSPRALDGSLPSDMESGPKPIRSFSYQPPETERWELKAFHPTRDGLVALQRTLTHHNALNTPCTCLPWECHMIWTCTWEEELHLGNHQRLFSSYMLCTIVHKISFFVAILQSYSHSCNHTTANQWAVVTEKKNVLWGGCQRLRLRVAVDQK